MGGPPGPRPTPSACLRPDGLIALAKSGSRDLWGIVAPLAGLPPLALRTKMGPTLRNKYAPDRRRADQTRLRLLPINTVPQLEAAPAAFRIHVVGNRGAASLNGFKQH